MTDSSFQVDPSQVRSHAQTVGTIATQLQGVGSSVQTGLDGNAFGVFGQFLASGILQALGEVKDSIDHASSTVDNVHTGLGLSADNYQHVDEHNSDGMSGKASQ